MTDPLQKCFSEAKLNGLTLRNRIIKAATFEGMSPGGIPSEKLMRLHERHGEGGVAMTTVAYCAAEADGRINENMLYMHEGIRPELEQLIGRVKATGAAVSGQLGHCGNFTKNAKFTGKRPLGPSGGVNKLGLTAGLPMGGSMTKKQIRERVQVFAEAASFMKSVGFDAVEIHFGHGYGLSQFISPLTNKRKDEYGGKLSNRMRMPLETLEAVRAAVGDDYPILGKISMTDGAKGGITYDDGIEVAAHLEKGGIDAIICSGGTSSHNPMLLFRGDSILDELLQQEKSSIMKIGMKFMGPMMFKDYPYEENYFLEEARRVRDRVQCGVCYIGGTCTSESIRTVMDAGFDFIQMGRGLLYDPDMPKNAADDPSYVNGCNHCNKCAGLIDDPGGILCVEAPENFAVE